VANKIEGRINRIKKKTQKKQKKITAFNIATLTVPSMPRLLVLMVVDHKEASRHPCRAETSMRLQFMCCSTVTIYELFTLLVDSKTHLRRSKFSCGGTVMYKVRVALHVEVVRAPQGCWNTDGLALDRYMLGQACLAECLEFMSSQSTVVHLLPRPNKAAAGESVASLRPPFVHVNCESSFFTLPLASVLILLSGLLELH
jgi:hypothetical protein